MDIEKLKSNLNLDLLNKFIIIVHPWHPAAARGRAAARGAR
eukprot:SAG31_NODE_5402_length_2557_cov_4.867372_1_plen_40_part_10